MFVLGTPFLKFESSSNHLRHSHFTSIQMDWNRHLNILSTCHFKFRYTSCCTPCRYFITNISCTVLYLINNYLNPMELSPSWERNNHLANHKISCILRNQKIHYRFHKSLSLSQMNSIHIFPPHFPKIVFNIVPSTPRSSKWYFPFRLSDQNFV
jgi:hypothetical protein